MIELLLPCGFDTGEYAWEKATIDICTLVDYSVAKKCQQAANALALLGSSRESSPPGILTQDLFKPSI
jgi:hypothetical protein